MNWRTSPYERYDPLARQRWIAIYSAIDAMLANLYNNHIEPQMELRIKLNLWCQENLTDLHKCRSEKQC